MDMDKLRKLWMLKHLHFASPSPASGSSAPRAASTEYVGPRRSYLARSAQLPALSGLVLPGILARCKSLKRAGSTWVDHLDHLRFS